MEKLPGAISSREFFYALIWQQIVFFYKIPVAPSVGFPARNLQLLFRNAIFTQKMLDRKLYESVWKKLTPEDPQKNPSARWRLKGRDEAKGKCRLRP